MSLPLSLYNAAQVRELDRRAIETNGIPGAELMARAGAATFAALREMLPRARRLAVACGPGNNGGDGYATAGLAKRAGLDPIVLTLGKNPSGADAALMRTRCESTGVPIEAFAPTRLADVDVIVDAMLGTGLERDVAGEWRAAIEVINASGVPVVSVDVPSGLNADTGTPMGVAIRARLTVTFIGLKAGLFLADGPDYAGTVAFDDLAVPAAAFAGVAAAAVRLAPENLGRLIRPRARNAHKGTFGHVLVIGGGPGMAGAARLCGEAALRVGAGLVTIATHPSHAAVVNASRPELLVFGVRSGKDLKPLIERASVIALGPGLAKDGWSRTLWRAALEAGLPLVVDADALNLLAANRRRRADWVLTPHPGEAARLLNTKTAAIQRDRVAAVGRLVDRYGGVGVLKGAGTVVADEHSTWLCDRGNPGMASGGMGDVLTGAVAALRAQGLSAVDAARLGVWLHATAGDAAAQEGEIGLVASDLFSGLRHALNRLVEADAAHSDGE